MNLLKLTLSMQLNFASLSNFQLKSRKWNGTLVLKVEIAISFAMVSPITSKNLVTILQWFSTIVCNYLKLSVIALVLAIVLA